ncbi:hypothetical protein ISN44_As09g028920 [Arabidopsis suecica]|uniref:Uncharacterized protein n=1 Tax=Arabidopsis suecica TaxID=45249 RepID=A0A8T2AKG3_ARASU|nr:hypothetical protein ISN44_As09g028920 [Arabidopsis suecica]
MENMDVGLVEVEAVINEAEAEPDEPANIGAMVHAAAVFVLNKGKVSSVTSVDLVWTKWWGIVRVNIFSRWR